MAAVAVSPATVHVPDPVKPAAAAAHKQQQQHATQLAYTLPPSPPLSDDDDARADDRLAAAAERTRVNTLPEIEIERPLGETELSYFLPSREDGVNDMYTHIGLTAPAAFFAPERIRAAWALSRLRHPPLAARVRMELGAYSSARFVYAPPRSVADALSEADAALEFSTEDGDVLLDRYLNGPRTLGPERISYMMIGCSHTLRFSGEEGMLTPAATPGAEAQAFTLDTSEDDVRHYDIFMCTTHFLGDGMALGRFMNEFFLLLGERVGSDGAERTTAELEALLAEEWEALWGPLARSKNAEVPDVFPCALEDALPEIPVGRLRAAAHKVDFVNTQKKAIGYHAFPRVKGKPRRTLVPTVCLDEARTRTALKTCKAHGVSIANAMFALSALAWSRMQAHVPGAGEKPIMMYSAMNMRPYMLPSATVDKSFWITSIGYMNVILPTFLPPASSSTTSDAEKDESTESAEERTFWRRARACKAQITAMAKSPLIIARTQLMAADRGARARAWAAEDDARAAGTWVDPPKAPAPAPAPSPSTPSSETSLAPWKLPPAPSTALVGLSMLGNLDGIFQHARYPSLRLVSARSGSRQRSGALLLFAYTFVGKLWLSLGYDVNGFEKGVVERWYEEVKKGVDTFLVGGPALVSAAAAATPTQVRVKEVEVESRL